MTANPNLAQAGCFASKPAARRRVHRPQQPTTLKSLRSSAFCRTMPGASCPNDCLPLPIMVSARTHNRKGDGNMAARLLVRFGGTSPAKGGLIAFA